MAEPTTLYLLRHAEIDRPPVALFDDAVLTERGREQIHRLALGWPHPKPDFIYCSPLPRSVETAGVLAAVFRRPVHVMPELEEWAATERDVPQEKYVELERRSWADPEYENDEGESLKHASNRITRALGKIARRHPGGSVIVSGHSILFALFLARQRKEPATEEGKNRIAFGAYAVVEYRRRFRIVRDFEG